MKSKNTKKNKIYDRKYANDLLAIAFGDLETAETLLKSRKPGRLENIIFIAQQSVEKAIKAVLVHEGIAFPLVHDLGILIALLPSHKQPPGGFELIALNPYASIRRYEAGPLPLEKSEAKLAVEAAQQVIKWSNNIIK